MSDRKTQGILGSGWLIHSCFIENPCPCPK